MTILEPTGLGLLELGLLVGLGLALCFAVCRFVHLRRAKQQLIDLVQASAIGILVLRKDGTLYMANQQVELAFGYSRIELAGLPVARLFTDAGPLLNLLASRPALPIALDGEHSGLHRLGWRVPVEAVVSQLHGVPGAAALVSLVNISARHRLQQNLDQQRSELERVSKVMMLKELSGSFAHELNQPLMAILGNAQAALIHLDRKDPDLSELKDILSDIVQDNKRASEIIRGLRALYGKGELLAERFDINELVEQTLVLTGRDLFKQDIHCSTELDQNLTPVLAVRIQIQQVLINLLINACESMRSNCGPSKDANPASGPMVLQISTLNLGDSVQLCVADEGAGLPADQCARVFEPFYTTKKHGMGLGLAVCRKVMQAHNGKLWASDNDRGGASFYLTLPLATSSTSTGSDLCLQESPVLL